MCAFRSSRVSQSSSSQTVVGEAKSLIVSYCVKNNCKLFFRKIQKNLSAALFLDAYVNNGLKFGFERVDLARLDCKPDT